MLLALLMDDIHIEALRVFIKEFLAISFGRESLLLFNARNIGLRLVFILRGD
jgi:hypothetical protein